MDLPPVPLPCGWCQYRAMTRRSPWRRGRTYAREVATLEHEVGDDTVEGRALVAEAMLVRRELAEVARGLGDHIVVELEDDAAEWPAVDGDIKL